ncbi:MAG: 50S ribosomal protein L15 [Proteobacteria bacterium]|nr:50S ribosomal protein L15 [Pseudomonadota bacterium]
MANELSNLKPSPGSTRSRMRVGRGEGSGKGKTAGRGTKGAQSRSGYSRRPGFEGGQMPLQRRLPKKGFTNIFAKDFEVVNVARLADLEAGSEVTAESLKAAGIISRIGKDGVKVLGRGELGVALHVRVSKLSRTAAEKILAAGGSVEGPVPGAGA